MISSVCVRRGAMVGPPNGRRTVNRKAWLYGEPSIDEMLSDPIVRLVMRRDDVSEADIRRAIRPARVWLCRTESKMRLVA